MKDTTIITITAITCVTALETFALLRGLDGKILAASFLIIGGLGGYHLKDTISTIIHPTTKTEETTPPSQPPS